MNNKNRPSGLGFTSVLTIVFIVLKLTDVINWSWWLVLSPTLINIALTIIIGICCVIYLTNLENNRNVYNRGGRRIDGSFKKNVGISE